MNIITNNKFFRERITIDREERMIVNEKCRRWKDLGEYIRIYSKYKTEIHEFLKKSKKE